MVLCIVKKTRRRAEKAVMYREENEAETCLRTVASVFGLGDLGSGAPNRPGMQKIDNRACVV